MAAIDLREDGPDMREEIGAAGKNSRGPGPRHGFGAGRWSNGAPTG